MQNRWKWVAVCLRTNERENSFHLHNNEVVSEAIGSVCLQPNCAHVLIDSVLHYFADPGLSQKPHLQRNRTGAWEHMYVCLSLFCFFLDTGKIVLPDSKIWIIRWCLPIILCQLGCQVRGCTKLICNYSFGVVWMSRKHLSGYFIRNMI